MKGIFVEKIEPAIAEKDWYYRRVLNKFADLMEPGYYSQMVSLRKKHEVTIYYQVIEGMGEPSLHRAMDVFYGWKPWQPFKPITTSKEKEMQITISQKTLEAKKKQYEIALRVATEMDFYYNQEINEAICSAGNYKATQAQSDYQDLMENLRCKILKLNSLCLAESITLPESDYSELFSAIEIPSIKDLDPDLYTCSTMQAPEVEQSDPKVEQSEEQPEEAEEPEPVDLADSLL